MARNIWKDKIIEELEKYRPRKQAEKNIPEQIRELESEMTSIKSPGTDNTGGRGGGGRYDDRYLNNIVTRELLAENLKEVKRQLKRMDRALSTLTDEEMEIVISFYMDQEKEAAFNLADRLNIDRKTVYPRRETALKKLSQAMYGKD